jgi:prolipoprotein diacylglyceryltransferase
MEFSLLGAAAMAAFAFWAMLRWEGKRGNAAGCAVNLWDAGLVSAMSGLLAGRLVAMLEAGINPLTNLSQVLLVRSGVSTAAAGAVALVTFAFISRKDLLPAADAIAPAALAGLAGWHAGCIPTGACLGSESALPWARALEGSDITRHPVELYAAIGLALASVSLALWKQYGRPPLGSVAGFALIAAGAVRLATEPMRISLAGGPLWVYGASIVLGSGLIVWSLVHRRRRVTRPD